MSEDVSREMLPDYVADYLLESTLSLLPRAVIEALASLSEEQIDGLRIVGKALKESDASEYAYMLGVH
jgi:hypothetical protein